MPITGKFEIIPISKITIKRDERQRKVLEDIDSLAESIRVNGLIHPILVKRVGQQLSDDVGSFQTWIELVAGERRLTAVKTLGWTTVPVQYAEDLSDEESQAIELEENIRRKNLTWQEELDAMSRIHRIYMGRDTSWTLEKTAEAIGIAPSTLTKNLAVVKEIEAGNTRLLLSPKVTTAVKIVERKKQREAQVHLDTLLSDIGLTNKANPAESESPILNQSFLHWAPEYTGPKFNFLHCDFPYGVDLQSSDQMGEQGFAKYHDSKEVYWQLLECLAENWTRLMSPSSSIMFWFSMKFYSETFEFFSTHIPQLELSYMPMIWVKSDNKGILPDAAHGPRQIYETCLVGYSGDRQVVSSVSNAYSCPTSKEIHMSEKPIPMLKQFFKMYVDETTSMLDPTCGSANALRAADALGAKRVFGLEIEPEIYESALRAFKLDRKLRKISA